MGLFILGVIGIGVGFVACATIRGSTLRQLGDLHNRHREAAKVLAGTIDQRRLVAENLIDTLSGLSIRDVELRRLSEAERGVKESIRREDGMEELVTRGRELDDSVSEILPVVSEKSHTGDPLVAACLQGWNDSSEPIEQATLAYNDAVMTWNEFLQSRRVRWLGRFAKPMPLGCVEWDTHSSDVDQTNTDVKDST